VEILEDRLRAYDGRIPRNRVTLLLDAAYGVKRVLGSARKKGLTCVGKLKKYRRIRLFSRWMRVEEYFGKYKKERYFTSEGRRVFYKEAILEVKELGRVKVFRLREEGEAEHKNKYYVTDKHKMTARTCYRYKKLRWKIEDMHRDMKQYLGLGNTCAWKKEPLLAHYSYVFYLWWLFERFRAEQELDVSFEALWWEYCAGMEKAKMQRMQLGEPPPIAALFSYI
jgi:hypothetical protein